MVDAVSGRVHLVDEFSLKFFLHSGHLVDSRAAPGAVQLAELLLIHRTVAGLLRFARLGCRVDETILWRDQNEIRPVS